MKPPARSTFRIVLEQRGEADAFQITDAAGGHVTLLVRVEGFEMSLGRIDLPQGRSPEASAEAREVVVVLFRGRIRSGARRCGCPRAVVMSCGSELRRPAGTKQRLPLPLATWSVGESIA